MQRTSRLETSENAGVEQTVGIEGATDSSREPIVAGGRELTPERRRKPLGYTRPMKGEGKCTLQHGLVAIRENTPDDAPTDRCMQPRAGPRLGELTRDVPRLTDSRWQLRQPDDRCSWRLGGSQRA